MTRSWVVSTARFPGGPSHHTGQRANQLIDANNNVLQLDVSRLQDASIFQLFDAKTEGRLLCAVFTHREDGGGGGS